MPATPLKAAPDPLALLDSAAAREAPSSESVTRVTVAPPAPQPVITPPATVRDPLAFLDEPAAVTQVSRPAPERVPAADVVARASAVSPTPQAVVAAPVAHITRVTPPVRADSPTPQAEVAVPVADRTRVTPPVRADSPTPPAPAVAGIVTGVTPPAPAVSPEPRDARPLDVPAKRERPAPMISEQEAPDELPLPASSRAPLFLGLGLVLLLAVGGGLFAFAKPTPASTPTAPQTNPVVTNLLKKMDEQMMAGRYAGPGGDTALDSLQVALATAPDNARVKEYQEKLASFFERRVTEATAKSDHAEAAVALIALSLADPKRAGVKEKLLAEVDQVKNQAKTK